jgi:hypothetical protein
VVEAAQAGGDPGAGFGSWLTGVLKPGADAPGGVGVEQHHVDSIDLGASKPKRERRLQVRLP